MTIHVVKSSESFKHVHMHTQNFLLLAGATISSHHTDHLKKKCIVLLYPILDTLMYIEKLTGLVDALFHSDTTNFLFRY
jgi:hypothetical protein